MKRLHKLNRAEMKQQGIAQMESKGAGWRQRFARLSDTSFGMVPVSAYNLLTRATMEEISRELSH
jgi:hypothetical protein